MVVLDKRHSFYWLAGLVAAFAVSFIGYFVPVVVPAIFGLVVAAYAVITWRTPTLALLIALSELVVGAHGYLLVTSLFGQQLSIRLAFFVILTFASVVRIQQSFREWWRAAASWLAPFAPFAIVVGVSFLLGMSHDYTAREIFLDGNGYLAFGLLLPLSLVRVGEGFKEAALRVVLLSSAYVAVQTVVFLYIFSHAAFGYYIFDLYTWLRQNVLAEVTATTTGAARIFTPSQLFLLLSWWIVVWRSSVAGHDQKKVALHTLGALYAASLLVSFSRSFWLGWAVSFLVAVMYFVLQRNIRALGRLMLHAAISVLVGFGLLFIVVRFPFPGGGGELLSLAGRFDFAGDAAASSRWNQLEPLRNAIYERPFFGSGFGRSITYISNDPRVRAQQPSGDYTTTALEWGYLDMLLEFGLVGVVAFFVAVGACLRGLWKGGVSAGGIAIGVVAALVTGIGSPYFNHPLGVSLLLLAYVIGQHGQGREVAIDKRLSINSTTAVDL